MKNNLSILVTLALAAALLPAAFAQQSQSTQPKSDQTQSQPGSDQSQGQTTPAPGASADTQTQNFSGAVVKAGEHYVLKTDKMTYQLDDETKAKQFEGKQVTVNGTLDKSTGVIRVTDIQPVS
jgi:flagellar basal body-associated protein FliL